MKCMFEAWTFGISDSWENESDMDWESDKEGVGVRYMKKDKKGWWECGVLERYFFWHWFFSTGMRFNNKKYAILR